MEKLEKEMDEIIKKVTEIKSNDSIKKSDTDWTWIIGLAVISGLFGHQKPKSMSEEETKKMEEKLSFISGKLDVIEKIITK